nr:clavesin-1-like [Leptinotarsa decemlineata]
MQWYLLVVPLQGEPEASVNSNLSNRVVVCVVAAPIHFWKTSEKGFSLSSQIPRGECVPHRTDDAFILRFLRGRNFVLERAHRLKGNWDPERLSTDELFQSTMIVLELAILEQRAQILGGVCIFDLGGLSLQQAWYITPSIAHKIVQIMVTSFPMKVHALHIVNQSWIFDMIYNIFKPFVDERMKEKIFFHGEDMESLHQHIDPKHLPEKYGGIHPDYDYKDWIKYFENNEKIRWELETLGYRDDKEKTDLGKEEV